MFLHYSHLSITEFKNSPNGSLEDMSIVSEHNVVYSCVVFLMVMSSSCTWILFIRLFIKHSVTACLYTLCIWYLIFNTGEFVFNIYGVICESNTPGDHWDKCNHTIHNHNFKHSRNVTYLLQLYLQLTTIISNIYTRNKIKTSVHNKAVNYKGPVTLQVSGYL